MCFFATVCLTVLPLSVTINPIPFVPIEEHMFWSLVHIEKRVLETSYIWEA